MFYMVMVPVLVFLAFEIYKLLELKKHDEHLYAFCKLRRHSIEYLYANRESLSRDEYVALRQLIWVLNNTIHAYRSHKTVIFNFRRLVRYISQLEKSSKEHDRIHTENKDIQKLLRTTDIELFRAFLAFTPFFKSELLIKLAYLVLSAATKAGFRKLNTYAIKLNEAKDLIASKSDLLHAS